MSLRQSLLASAAALLVASYATAHTWNVREDGSGDAPTVQAGIDSSVAGDTILVHPGTYSEDIDFLGKAIVVRSSGGAESTTLNGRNPEKGWVVVFQSGESRAARLEGFTITGGTLGVLINSAEPSVVGNIITGNGVAQFGGGIWCNAAPFTLWFPLIQGNTITNNRANGLAGGVGFAQNMVPEILDNYIADNEVRDGDGGGIYFRSLFENETAIIRGNVVINNRAGDHGGGIYVAMAGSPPPALKVEISWNLVANNVANGSAITGISGGGLHLIETDAWVHHNTIVGNEGGGTSTTLGGGIGIERIGSPLIEKNVIAFTTQGGGVNCVGGATPVFRNNLTWLNAGGEGVGECATWWQSDGNIVADPNFCNLSAGDYSLAQNSPAITHVAGPLGGIPIPGCGPVQVEPTTWGRLKTLYGH